MQHFRWSAFFVFPIYRSYLYVVSVIGNTVAESYRGTETTLTEVMLRIDSHSSVVKSKRRSSTVSTIIQMNRQPSTILTMVCVRWIDYRVILPVAVPHFRYWLVNRSWTLGKMESLAWLFSWANYTQFNWMELLVLLITNLLYNLIPENYINIH